MLHVNALTDLCQAFQSSCITQAKEDVVKSNAWTWVALYVRISQESRNDGHTILQLTEKNSAKDTLAVSSALIMYTPLHVSGWTDELSLNSMHDSAYE